MTLIRAAILAPATARSLANVITWEAHEEPQRDFSLPLAFLLIQPVVDEIAGELRCASGSLAQAEHSLDEPVRIITAT
jgi:hypothetical protein